MRHATKNDTKFMKVNKWLGCVQNRKTWKENVMKAKN